MSDIQILEKNIASQKLMFSAFNEITGADVIADSGNMSTKKISKDGGAGATLTNSPAEVDSTNMPGLYSVVLETAETNCEVGEVRLTSTTPNVKITPARFTTTVTDAILLDTAEIGTAGAGLTNITWNGDWDAQVESECTDALNNYDPPTKAELDSGFSTTNSSVAVIDGIVDLILGDTNELQSDDIPGKLTTLSGKVDVVDGIVDSILLDTAEIGTAGAGLTDLGGMCTSMAAEVQVEANDALVANKLDHLFLAPLLNTDVTNASAWAQLCSSSAVADQDSYDNETDSLQAIRDNLRVEADASLAAYDPPTKAELDSAVVTITTSVAGVDGKVDAVPTAVENVAALMADTGFTAGGTTTYADFLKILASWAAGDVRDKSGSTGVVEYLDLDNSTVVYEVDWETSTPYRTSTVA